MSAGSVARRSRQMGKLVDCVHVTKQHGDLTWQLGQQPNGQKGQDGQLRSRGASSASRFIAVRSLPGIARQQQASHISSVSASPSQWQQQHEAGALNNFKPGWEDERTCPGALANRNAIRLRQDTSFCRRPSMPKGTRLVPRNQEPARIISTWQAQSMHALRGQALRGCKLAIGFCPRVQPDPRSLPGPNISSTVFSKDSASLPIVL